MTREQPARLEPGEIVVIKSFQDKQNAGGKPRPAVLVESIHGSWHVMGLTTLSHYAEGEPRVPCPPQDHPDFQPDRSWLWGPNLPAVPEGEIKYHVSWANDQLVDAIIDLTGRPAFRLDEMRPHARRLRNRNRRRSA